MINNHDSNRSRKQQNKQRSAHLRVLAYPTLKRNILVTQK